MIKFTPLKESNNIETPIVKTINNIYKKLLILCAFTHLFYLLIFFYMNIEILVIFNIFSVIIYLLLMLKPLHSAVTTIFFTIHFEVSIHASLAIILIGWDYGFAYLILCLITLMYISPFKNKIIPYIYGIIEIILFLFIRIYCIYNEPIYTYSSTMNIKGYLYFFNMFLFFIIIIFLSILNNTTNDLAQSMLNEKNKDLQKIAARDPLTNLYNRRYMQIKINEAVDLQNMFKSLFCIVIGDIDNFKNFNDIYGHRCGDFILKSIADKFVSSLRESDSVCRWGGEEFLILIQDIDLEKSLVIVERIRKSISNETFIYKNQELKVTMTFGLSCCKVGVPVEQTIEEADRLLYIGKKRGKNCVVSKLNEKEEIKK